MDVEYKPCIFVYGIYLSDESNENVELKRIHKYKFM